ncbi:MAG: PP2C family protein-serine/threonine phosphatase [Candidatus Acidiferrales bacterium]|jgi:sigma-B regulation protein RsbU (phosphoserine phosphatase)
MQLISPEIGLSPLEIFREQELDEARAIQGAMLPAETLHIGKVSFAHRLRSMHEVGGDFLDYFALSDDTVGVYLGDVAGKGLPAALYAALVVGTLRGVHKTGQPPSAVLSLLNKRLCARAIASRYAAMLYAVFDPRSREMRISSAGMHGPLHLSAKDSRNLRLTGLPPGLFADTQYETSTLTIEPGESVIFMTDGIVEAGMNGSDRVGVEHIVDLCRGRASSSPTELLDCIFGSVEQSMGGNVQHDDMAAAVFHFAE